MNQILKQHYRGVTMSQASNNAVHSAESEGEARVASAAPQRPWSRPLLGVAAAALMATSFTGCMTVHNGWEALSHNGAWNDTVIVLRNRSFSAKAWHRRKHHFCNEKYLKDFCAGFRAGYEDTAAGKGECTPAFPPQEYWGWDCQSAEGHARSSAWFAGYPQGARAAEEDGLGSWQQIPMSSGLQAEYQQTGMFTHQGALYPIPDEDNQVGSMPMEGQVIIDDRVVPAQPLEMPEALEQPLGQPGSGSMSPVPMAPAETGTPSLPTLSDPSL
jgi:hypothetical protein